MDNKIIAVADDNTQVELFIIDSLVLKGETYILASEEDPDEEDGNEEIEATLLKEIPDVDDYVNYVFVEDEEEYEKVMNLFMQNDSYEINN